jgi:hypothetical protein
MGLFNKQSGSQASHHSASQEDSAQPLRRHSTPENAQNSSSPRETEQPHQISTSRTPAPSNHHASKVSSSSHTTSHSQPSKQPSHRIATLNKTLPSVDTHLQHPEIPEDFSPPLTPFEKPEELKKPIFQTPDFQTSSHSVPPKAPVSPKTKAPAFPKPKQDGEVMDLQAPKLQHPHCSTTPDSPVSPSTSESPKYPSSTQHSDLPHHFSNK